MKFQAIILIVPLIKNVSHSKSESNSTTKEERIVTDLEIIESNDAVGVPIDYNYNETRTVNLYSEDSEENSIPSDPGCPKSIDGIPWLQCGNPPKCYLVGYKGPCDSGEILVLESLKSRKTTCACTTLMEENDRDRLEASNDGKYLFSEIHPNIIYSRSDKKCHFLNAPSPMCKEGHVLVRLRNTSTVKCLPGFRGSCGYNYETQTCEVVKPVFGQFGSGGGGFGAVGPVLPRYCGRDEKYSATLKRCVKVNGKGFLLG